MRNATFAAMDLRDDHVDSRHSNQIIRKPDSFPIRCLARESELHKAGLMFELVR